jgi:hypothetical protein
MGFVSFLLVLGPHGLELLFHVRLQLIFRDGVVMVRVGLGKTAPDEVRHFILGQLSVLVRVRLREQEVDRRLSLQDVSHPKRTGTDTVRAHRSPWPAPLVESAVEGERVTMPEAPPTVSAEAPMMGEAAVLSESVSPVMSPTELAAVASAMMSKAVSAVMAMPAPVPVSVPMSAMTRPTEFAVMSMTTVLRPTMPAVMAPAMMMVMVTSPGVTGMMTAPVSSVMTAMAMMSAMSAPMSLVLTVLSPFVPPFTVAAPAVLGMLSPAVFPTLVIAPLGDFAPTAVAMPPSACPWAVIGLFTICAAVMSAWTIVPPVGFLVSSAATVISTVAPVIRQFVCPGFVGQRRSPVNMGCELHQSGSHKPAQEHQNIVSHFTIPSPNLTTLLQSRPCVTLAGLP